MMIVSPAFHDQSDIPTEYTCEGDNINPPLEFNDVPAGTVSLAVVVEDPDSPNRTWQHWLIWNLDPHTDKLAAGEIPTDAVEGMNDFGRLGYGGPCPATGSHHYIFKLMALDTKLMLSPGASRAQLDEAVAKHIIAEANLTGTFKHAVGHEPSVF